MAEEFKISMLIQILFNLRLVLSYKVEWMYLSYTHHLAVTPLDLVRMPTEFNKVSAHK